GDGHGHDRPLARGGNDVPLAVQVGGAGSDELQAKPVANGAGVKTDAVVRHLELDGPIVSSAGFCRFKAQRDRDALCERMPPDVVHRLFDNPVKGETDALVDAGSSRVVEVGQARVDLEIDVEFAEELAAEDIDGGHQAGGNGCG